MSQNPVQIPTASPLPGLTLVNDTNAAFSSLVTLLSGSSAPTTGGTGLGSLAGILWHNTSTNTINIRDQADTTWMPIAGIDETNKVWVPPIGGGTTTLASATTTNLGSVPQAAISITGTTTITGFGSSAVIGTIKALTFAGILTLTYNATSLILPGAANYTTAAGDVFFFQYNGSSNWQCVGYTLASGKSLVSSGVAPAPITNVLASDVALNNTGTFFDGPSIAQGSVGTWVVQGTVTIYDTVQASVFNLKLWDGTNVISTGSTINKAANQQITATLSGISVNNPPGNLRISVNDAGTTSGAILHNISGLGKDSTISAYRIL